MNTITLKEVLNTAILNSTFKNDLKNLKYVHPNINELIQYERVDYKDMYIESLNDYCFSREYYYENDVGIISDLSFNVKDYITCLCVISGVDIEFDQYNGGWYILTKNYIDNESRIDENETMSINCFIHKELPYSIESHSDLAESDENTFVLIIDKEHETAQIIVISDLSWKKLLENKIKDLGLSCTFDDLRILCGNKNDLSVSFDKDESKIHIDFIAYVNLSYQQRYVFMPSFNINNKHLEVKSLSLYEIEK